MRVLVYVARTRRRTSGAYGRLWGLTQALVDAGHRVDVVVSGGKVRKRVTGANFHKRPQLHRYADLADVVLTHTGALDLESPNTGTPIVSVASSTVVEGWAACPQADAVLWDSETRRGHAIRNGFPEHIPSEVVWWHLDPDRYHVQPGGRVTWVGLFDNKGAGLFAEVARLLPGVPFTAVESGWGRKVADAPKLPDNVQVMPFQQDVRNVYRQASAMLYAGPSHGSPDWLLGIPGVAVEAAISGIPTIHHPGAGFTEAMGGASIPVDSDDPHDWAYAIQAVVRDQEFREHMREIVLERSREFPTPEETVTKLEAFLRQVAP